MEGLSLTVDAPSVFSPHCRHRRFWRRSPAICATAAVSELAEDLVELGVERVTVESTSDYWRTKDALSFNNLVTSWPEILEVARAERTEPTNPQGAFDFDEDD